jgi:predicted ATPase
MVGREQEIALLLERWRLAQDGDGQVVLLSGEPGVGKSRMLSALRERLETTRARTLRFQCSPYYVNSPFWPSIETWSATLKFAREESPATKLDKIEAIHGHPLRPAPWRRALHRLNLVHSLRGALRGYAHDAAKAEGRNAQVAGRSDRSGRAQPTQCDAVRRCPLGRSHDTGSARSIGRSSQERPAPDRTHSSARVRVTLVGAGHVSAINLSKLTRAQSTAILLWLAGGKALPPALLEQILAKTDGVPLFVEELTKSILESGELKDIGDRYDYGGAARIVNISLHAQRSR